MKRYNTLQVDYKIIDKGIETRKQREIDVPENAQVIDILKKDHNKYRRADGLSPKFEIQIIKTIKITETWM
jgi:hypothetical protein